MTASCMTAASFPYGFAMTIDDVREGSGAADPLAMRGIGTHPVPLTIKLPSISSDIYSRRS